MQERLARAWATLLLAALVAAALVGLALIRGALTDAGDATDRAKSEPILAGREPTARTRVPAALTKARNASDRAKNARILDGLEPPAGTLAQSITSKPSYESIDEVHERRVGYATDLEYNVPKGVSQREVVRNYDRQLRGWNRHEKVVPCEEYAAGDVPANCKPIVIVEYTRGRERVSLNIDGYGGARPWGYELTLFQREK